MAMEVMALVWAAIISSLAAEIWLATITMVVGIKTRTKWAIKVTTSMATIRTITTMAAQMVAI